MRRPHRLSRTLRFPAPLMGVGVLAFILLMAGCSGESGTDPDPTPTISISVSPGSLSLEQGDDGSVTITLARGGGYAGPVTLSFSGLPAGVVASEGSIAAGSTRVEVTLASTSTATVGTTTVTVSASGSGVSAARASFGLEVAPAPVGDFALSVDPGALSLVQGASGSVDVVLDRSGGFEGPVDLDVAGAPAGLSAALAETHLTGSGTTLDLEVGGALAPGEYTLVVTASGQGTDDRTAEVVVAVGAAGLDVAWQFCSSAVAPLWVAYKDGDGPWTRVLPTGGEYHFTVSEDRAGVAYALEEQEDGGVAVFTVLAARDEFEGSRPFLLAPSDCRLGAKTVNLEVAPNLKSGEFASASAGLSTSSIVATGAATIEMEGVPDGPVDVLGARGREGAGGATTVDRLYLERDVVPGDQATLPLDFDGAHAFAPDEADLTVSNLAGDEAEVVVRLDTPSTFGELLHTTVAGGASVTSVTAPLVPLSMLGNDDAYVFEASTFLGNDAPGASFRALSVRTPDGGDGGDHTLSFGPDVTGVVMDADPSGSTMRGRMRYDPQADYGDFFLGGFEQEPTPDHPVGQLLLVSARWLSGGAVSVSFPDLTGVAGWDPAWELQPGLPVKWLFTAYGWTGDGVRPPLLGASPGTLLSAALWGAFTP